MTSRPQWLARYRAEGAAGPQDRSSRPRRSPKRLRLRYRRQIELLRRSRWSTPRIAREPGLAVSTVVLEVKRLGLSRLERLDPPRRVIHYERQRPGELLQVDTKKLGRIGGVGHRIHRDRSRRSRGVGWEYLHACVDDATRMSYTEVLSDERGETCAGFIRWAVAWFQAQGIRVERVMTNNGAGYPVPGSSARRCASRASATCVRARTRPGPTGRSNASFRPPCASGRTPSPTHHRGCGSRP